MSDEECKGQDLRPFEPKSQHLTGAPDVLLLNLYFQQF